MLALSGALQFVNRRPLYKDHGELTSAIKQEIYNSYGKYLQIALIYWKMNFSLWRTFNLNQLAYFF